MEASLAVAERVGAEQKVIFFTEVYCPLSRACCLLRHERYEEAGQKFPDAIAQWFGAGMRVCGLWLKVLHAEALLGNNHADFVPPLLIDAEEEIEKPGYGERLALAEVLRLRACALVSKGKTQEAVKQLQRAIETAHEMKARFFELRATRDLAVILKNDGRQDEALRILKPIYEWFTEGHETRDLRSADALLAELKGLEHNVHL